MRHHERRLVQYLNDILAAIERIERYVMDLESDEFLVSDLVQDAVVRNFEIIGEASRHIVQRFPEFADVHKEIPFAHAYEMRNFVAHGYQQVDYEVVWKTVKGDLPQLAEKVRAGLHELPFQVDMDDTPGP